MHVQATHTINEYLAVEAAPNAFVVETGNVVTRLGASKWGGNGLPIVEYTGTDTVEVSPELQAEADRQSAIVARLKARLI